MNKGCPDVRCCGSCCRVFTCVVGVPVDIDNEMLFGNGTAE